MNGKTSLNALSQGVADGEFGHVILLFTEADEVVVDAGLVFPCVIEVEVFRLHIVFRELLTLKFSNVFKESLLLLHGHAPDHNGSVLEQKNFGRVDLSIEVGVVDSFKIGVIMICF